MRLLTRSGEHIIPQNQRTIIKEVFRGNSNHIRRIKFLIGDDHPNHRAHHPTPKRILVSTGERANIIEEIKVLWQKVSTAIGEDGLLELNEFYHEAVNATKPMKPAPIIEEFDQGLAIFERLIE